MFSFRRHTDKRNGLNIDTREITLEPADNARLRLLDPNRFHDFSVFVEEQQNYRPVADAVALLLAGKHLSNDELNTLSELIGEQDIEPLLHAANSDRDDADTARQELVSMLMDRHGTSRVLFRNTRNGVKGFPKRELHTIQQVQSDVQRANDPNATMGAAQMLKERIQFKADFAKAFSVRHQKQRANR